MHVHAAAITFPLGFGFELRKQFVCVYRAHASSVSLKLKSEKQTLTELKVYPVLRITVGLLNCTCTHARSNTSFVYDVSGAFFTFIQKRASGRTTASEVVTLNLPPKWDSAGSALSFFTRKFFPNHNVPSETEKPKLYVGYVLV